MNQATSSTGAANIATTIKATNVIAMIADLTIVNDHGRRDEKDARNNKSYNKKDDCKRDHFKKKSNEAMYNEQ